MTLLFARFWVPLLLCFYLIKKNPFYKSYPAVMPFSIILAVTLLFRLTKYSAKTNRMVH